MHQPEFPLVAVVFADRQAYLKFSRSELGDAGESVVGYFGGRAALSAIPFIRSAHVAIWLLAGAAVLVALIAHGVMWELHHREMKRHHRAH